MSNDNVGEDAQMLRRIETIEMYLKSLLALTMAPVLEEELSDDTAKAIYELVGVNTGQEIADKVGVSNATVSRALSRWAGMGILVKDGSHYTRVI